MTNFQSISLEGFAATLYMMLIMRCRLGSPAYDLLRTIVRPAIRCQRGRQYNTHTRPAPLRLDLTQDHPLIRPIGSSSFNSPSVNSEDFVYYPDFFTPKEQAVLIRLALWKLDRVDPKKKRTRRRRTESASKQADGFDTTERGVDLQSLFEDPSIYGFEEGHFDSVITDYRESLLTAFPDPALISPTIPYPSILSKVYSLLPASPGSELARQLYEDLVLPPTSSGSSTDASEEAWKPFAAPLQTTTHALHLSPTGRIDPHVDNVEASGSVIVGVSLGAERVLRLERQGRAVNITTGRGEEQAETGEGTGWEVLLKSGSVYVQRDSIRYSYAHSILPYSSNASVDSSGSRLRAGHRISLMIRDAKADFSTTPPPPSPAATLTAAGEPSSA